MNPERIGLVVLGVACVGLIGWNVTLSTELAQLRVAQTQASASAEIERSMSVASDEPGPRFERMRERRGGGWSQGGAWGAAEANAEDGEDAAAEGTEGEPRGERRERRQRDWAAMRADMETRTIDTVEAYGATHGWESQTTEDVLTILLDTSDAIAEVWGQVGTGDLTQYQARKEMMNLRQGSSDDIIGIVGEPAYEALDEHLWEARHEAWRASSDRGGEQKK